MDQGDTDSQEEKADQRIEIKINVLGENDEEIPFDKFLKQNVGKPLSKGLAMFLWAISVDLPQDRFLLGPNQEVSDTTNNVDSSQDRFLLEPNQEVSDTTNNMDNPN